MSGKPVNFSAKFATANKPSPMPAALITAGGYSSRMGGLKALLPFGPSTILGKAIETALGAGVADIVVVGGYRCNEIANVAGEYHVACINNTNFPEGMFSSVLCGLNFFIERGADYMPEAFLLLPVDAAQVEASLVLSIINYWHMLMQKGLWEKDNIIIPCFSGKEGHPPLIGSLHIQLIQKWSGADGLRGYLQDFRNKHAEKVHFFDSSDVGTLSDLDTIAEYFQACASLAGQEHVRLEKSEPKLYLMRHGSLETLQAADGGKAYVGRTDVPMSELGVRQIQACAKYIRSELTNWPVIWHSPSDRSKQSAALAAECFGGHSGNNICVPVLGEVSLGEWEGLSKGEVEARFASTFALRGKDFVGTRPEGGENLFDVAERLQGVVKALKKNQAAGRDIVISGHQTTLSVLLALLFDLPLECCHKMRLEYGSLSILRFSLGRYYIEKFNFVP